MKKKPLIVIGIGLEGRDSLSPRGLMYLHMADELWGNKRLLAGFSDLEIPKVELGEKLIQNLEILQNRDPDKKIVLLASGDPGFYGLGSTLFKLFPEEKIILIPQTGLLQEAFAAAGYSWEDAVLLSAHATLNSDLINTVKRNRKVGILTSPENTPSVISRKLYQAGLRDGIVFVFENLGMDCQNRFQGSIKECASRSFSDLNVMLLIRNKDWQPDQEGVVRQDDAYAHRNGLITKRDIRILCLDRMTIRPADIIWDIGAGSGALSIEAAERAWKGKVFSFEKDSDCIEFIRKNQERFYVQNLEIVPGAAPESLRNQPLPRTVFIGGTGGNLIQILDYLAENMVKPWNLVMNFTVLENLTAAAHWFKEHGYEPEILQADIKYTAKIEAGMRLVPQNPVFILSLSVGL